MDFTQARELLDKNIEQNLRHQDYPRTVALAEKYQKLITGENIDSLLKRFNPREDEELFEQRKALTIAITPSIVSSVMKPFYKVPRTQPLAAKVQPARDTADATGTEMLQVMEERMAGFYGADEGVNGLDYFLQNRFVELSFCDPNAWIIIESDDFNPDTEKARPRPFEVSSQDALNFQMRNNKPEWLIISTRIWLDQPDKKEKMAGTKYTLYAADIALVYEQTIKKDNPGEEVREIGGKFYIVREYNTKTKVVPAIRVGYQRDLVTQGRTFVAPFHAAMPYLDKSIKQVSEYDLSHCLHIFPQKIVRLAKSCPGVPGDPNGSCSHGRLRDGQICPTCNGTGRSVHTSSQDIIEVELPESIKEDGYIPLTDMIHYVDLPTELLKFQKECIDEFTPQCHQAVFNSTVLVKKDGSPARGMKTAFEVDTDMDSVYDTLQPFADKYSATWSGIVRMIAILTDYDEKITILHRFPAKFQLKSRERLYAEYKSAAESSLPAFVIDSIADELAETIYMDDADELVKYRVKKEHAPFQGKSKEEIMIAMTSTDTLRETKILYNYFDRIFLELEVETDGKIYLEPYERRKEAIEEKIQEIMDLKDDENERAMMLLQVQEGAGSGQGTKDEEEDPDGPGTDTGTAGDE